MKLKRICALAFACCLILPAAANAADDLAGRPVADGTVAAVRYTDVTAPFSGTLCPFTVEAGDAVQQGEALMELVTTKLYAPEDGVVRALFAAEGDSAADVCARYGGVLGIEPTHQLVLNATTSGAFDAAHRLLRLGETLYFRFGGTDGVGRVIVVSGNSYQVEVLEGNFDLGKKLNLYRNDKCGSSDCVGTAVVARRDGAMVQAAGRIVKLHVAEGDAVTAGQLLMEVVSADAAPDLRSAQVECPDSGVITAVAVQPGQQVWKGQTLFRVSMTDELEVIASVDETDLHGLKVGDTLPVTLDWNKARVLTGKVTEISSLGTARQNAAYYAVHVSIPAGSGPLGASASVYLPADGN